MSDAAPASPKKKAASKKPKTPASHPPVAQMVNAAIKNLKERKGSSLPAIKKYVAANYKVDIVKIAPFIKKYLRNGVKDGKLVQTKGTGATGSFKLPSKEKAEKKPATKKATKAKKPAGEKKAKKPKAKKPAAKKPAAKKAAKKPKAKTPKKAKKSTPKKASKPKTKKTATKSKKK